MFKMQQVLRTRKSITTESGTAIPKGTRVVVMNMVEDSNKVRVKVMDSGLPDLRQARAVGTEKSFDLTHRGRPRKTVEATPAPAAETPDTPSS